MSIAKPEFRIDLAVAGSSPLRAETYLSSLKQGASLHEKLDCRHPLGIYNVSIKRILQKLTSCASTLEQYIRVAPSTGELRSHQVEKERVIDYIELSLYAAAEHVDDLEAIARCFFPDNGATSRATYVRKFKLMMKPLRDRIAGFTNAIKHGQSRIRTYSYDFKQLEGSVCLHGFFIEEFGGGAVGPSAVFHTDERVISITSFLWYILIYLFLMSDALADFLEELGVVKHPESVASQSEFLKACVVALARLPLYSFDDEHPFKRVRFVIAADEKTRPALNSGIYGSLISRWGKSTVMAVGGAEIGYEGDGTTRSFRIVHPTAVNIQHWD